MSEQTILCPHCKKPVAMKDLEPRMKANVEKAIKRTAKEELISRISTEILQAPTFYEPVGCDKCNNAGYK